MLADFALDCTKLSPLDISALAGTENVSICPVNEVAPGEERRNPFPMETMSSIMAPRGWQWCRRLNSRKVCEGIFVVSDEKLTGDWYSVVRYVWPNR